MLSDARAAAAAVFLDTAARVDGEVLVREAAARLGGRAAATTHVLAVGKAAFPMLAGAREVLVSGGVPDARRALAIAPPGRIPGAPPAGVDVLAADHPHPSARSLTAARAAREFVARCGGGGGDGRAADRLLVLLSGGASALLCDPAAPLSLEEKAAAVAAVARGGATIAELNAVRKHLSAIKGGRLALETRAPVLVLALADVVGDSPELVASTIGSGPFSPDPTTYAEALRVAGARAGADFPAVARALLEAGARGERPETPKPGDARLAHVDFEVVAGPARVAAEARAAAERRGLRPGLLWRDTELDVETLAAAVLERAAHEAGALPARAPTPAPAPGASRAGASAGLALVGNGEPRIRVPVSAGTGGRATHLALLVARGLANLPDEVRGRVAFLAAGTDDRDGCTSVSGAAVDGGTWGRAAAAGVDPEAALRAHDSARALEAAGDTVAGPGTSNLLDLHLLVVLP